MTYTRPHEDRLGDGTPTAGDVLTYTGTGTAEWDTSGGGSLIVTDGIVTVSPTTTLSFTSGATVTDAGGGVAEVAISGSFTDDADTLFPTFEAGYDFPSGRAYIRQFDLGNPDQDAYMAANAGQVSLVAHKTSATDHAEAQVNLNNAGDPASIELSVVDDNDYSQIYISTSTAYVDAGAKVFQIFGAAASIPLKASAPSSPAEGDMYYDTTLHLPRYYNGTIWVAF